MSIIEHLLDPKTKDLGDFAVRRLFPVPHFRKIGPWVFFDHMGPADFAAGKGIDVRPHPHINLATVTYLFEGEIFHRDSLGREQAIRPGEINLMVAGKGIVHSERTAPELRQKGHRVHGLQLWLGLPEQDEEMDPEFHHYEAEEIPELEIDGARIRVIMGTAYQKTSPVKTFQETLYIEAILQKGQTIPLPMTQERGLYVANGAIQINSPKEESKTETVLENQFASLQPLDGLMARAEETSRVALIGGSKMTDRHIYWNFVSSRLERIEEAKRAWTEKRFPQIPQDSEEFIPLPEK